MAVRTCSIPGRVAYDIDGLLRYCVAWVINAGFVLADGFASPLRLTYYIGNKQYPFCYFNALDPQSVSLNKS